MQIIKDYPPNYSQILQYLKPSPHAIFAYGDTIYNPTGKDIPQDVVVHEEVHQRQMEGWLPDAWWQKYLMDKSFRLQAEQEAYSVQYRWVKDRVSNKIAKLCLFDLANNLQKLYNLGITYPQAETLIRKCHLKK